MPEAYLSPTGIVAYLALFAVVGLLFLFVNLLVGRFVRPSEPTPEKLEIYECGEPAIGSSFVQFDLRFYVVALLFISFDVEVAFFFPWATVFGKADHLADAKFAAVEKQGDQVVLTPQANLLYQEMGIRRPTVPAGVPESLRGRIAADGSAEQIAAEVIRRGGKQLAWVTIVDILLFFAVLLVGFAYVWKRGDLDWVRAVSRDRAQRQPTGTSIDRPREQQVRTV